MRILIIGSGAREHAIAWSLRKANPQIKLFCAPGNAGIAEVAQGVPVAPTDPAALRKFAHEESIDLTIVGPELPLVEGLVDAFEGEGLAIFGPSQAASRLEGSKAFAKGFMARNGIPTARYRVADSPIEAIEILRNGQFGSGQTPIVVKADGLAAGKGVIVAASSAEAEEAVTELARIGLAGPDKPLVIEEGLIGKEASVLVFADGRDYIPMPPARDHKRIGENETGPNTGGMGSITDESIIDDKLLTRVAIEIIEPTLAASHREGFPFKGILFFGLMLTADGPKVLEYNVRFGDPETQAILVRLNSDLLSLFQATREGTLAAHKVAWSEGASACVVLANRGYPGKYESGAVIHGLTEARKCDGVQVFHAGTAKSGEGEFLATGGRVLAVTATGATLSKALEKCYGSVEKISWEGMQYRRDIGGFSRRPLKTSMGQV